ncbi:cytochrome c oxidase assembly protein [Terriglobus sp. RCC_193]|uniref:cytochrome c oxidase assembly protein n=1 Tax=Terriglobus sp. RCC_193 TaxID=3239218 RepID=UPI0035266A06
MILPHHIHVAAFFFHPVEGGEALPSPSDLWTLRHWTWELNITIPLVLCAAWYLAGSVRRGRHTMLRWRHAAFWAGWLSLIAALVSPLHQLGDSLFSAHMLQHEILILVAAPLIAASHPSVTLLYALPSAARRTIGGLVSGMERHPILALATGPLASWLLHAVALWGWHIPFLYQASVTSDVVHALQHLCFFFTGLIFWSALFGAGRSSMSYGAATLYTFGTAIHCSALGSLLTFSTVIWYPIYADRTTAWHLTPLQDQQLGGLLMWVPSGIVFIVIGVALFARWIESAEERHKHTSMSEITIGGTQ